MKSEAGLSDLSPNDESIKLATTTCVTWIRKIQIRFHWQRSASIDPSLLSIPLDFSPSLRLTSPPSKWIKIWISNRRNMNRLKSKIWEEIQISSSCMASGNIATNHEASCKHLCWTIGSEICGKLWRKVCGHNKAGWWIERRRIAASQQGCSQTAWAPATTTPKYYGKIHEEEDETEWNCAAVTPEGAEPALDGGIAHIMAARVAVHP